MNDMPKHFEIFCNISLKNKAPEREKTLTFRFVILKMDVKYERDEGRQG